MAKRNPAHARPQPPGTPKYMPKGLPERNIIAALRKWGGIKALAAKECDISRQTMQDRVTRSPRLQAVIHEIEEETLDLGEGHITKGVREGDKDYVKYYMDRKGQKRGFGNKVQNSFDEQQLEAIVASLGGAPAKFAAALRSLGIDPDQA